jgi:hypothetical protein
VRQTFTAEAGGVTGGEVDPAEGVDPVEVVWSDAAAAMIDSPLRGFLSFSLLHTDPVAH